MSLATRLVLLLLSAAFSTLMGVQSLSRFANYHNRTFDLALYARQAWGLAHGDYSDPIVGVHFLGTHLAVVLWPLGVLGLRLGEVPVLLVAQALAFGLATLPLAQIGYRRFGEAGALCAAAAWLAYPNLSQVASYEFHPGSMGVLPLALALDALDRRRRVGFVVCCLCLLACRADFALMTAMLACSALWLDTVPPLSAAERPRLRSAAVFVLCLSVAYLALSVGVLRPRYWATQSSLDLHFVRWGGSPFGFGVALFQKPQLVLDHLLEPRRLSYLPRVLWPLCLLPLLSVRWLLPALPFIAINLISTFPTTLELYSHYLTPAVPTLIVAALDGLRNLRTRLNRLGEYAPVGLSALLACGLLANVQSGGLPWSASFDRSAFSADALSAQAARVVAAIPEQASVQAPDPLLAHLSARAEVYRSPPPERDAEYVVLDIDHRRRYARREDLLRTLEEPATRYWLSRDDYGLVHAEPSYLVFQRGSDPRAGPAARYLSASATVQQGIPLCRCLSVLSAWLDPQGLELELSASAPCPADLALRIIIPKQPERVDLLFDGLLSPATLRDEQVFSWHALSAEERAALRENGLALGAVRSTGTPPEPFDPIARPIAVVQ
jgi:uncharacterized membrane protein